MHSSTPARPAYLPQLTALRFFAAAAVIGCHFASYMFPNQPNFLAKFSNGFYNAVSLFFVLSGFILAHTYGKSLSNREVTYYKYFLARIARIYPVFLLGLAIDLPVFLVNNRHDFVGATKYHMIQKVLLLQTWLPTANEVTARWNAPSWSLSTEFFFYLVFPFLIVPIYRLSKRASSILLGVALGLTTGLSLFYDFYLSKTTSPTSESGLVVLNFIGVNPLIRVWEFIAGIALYNLYKHYSSLSPTTKGASWTFALGIGTLFYGLVNIFAPSVVIGQGLCTAYFALLILGLSLDKFSFFAFMKKPAFIGLGEASYSLYLIHIPIFFSAFAMFRKVSALQNFSNQYPLICGLLLLVISIYASILCFKFVEKPGRTYLLNKFSPKAAE